MNDDLRGTGRTTRMLACAISLAWQGKIVFVYCGTERHKSALVKQVLRMDKTARLHSESRRWAMSKVKVGSGSISFGLVTAQFNWRVMREPGVSEDVVTLIDHYTIETEFRSVLEMLHRFDPGAPSNK